MSLCMLAHIRVCVPVCVRVVPLPSVRARVHGFDFVCACAPRNGIAFASLQYKVGESKGKSYLECAKVIFMLVLSAYGCASGVR